jgi:hypothetical protein
MTRNNLNLNYSVVFLVRLRQNEHKGGDSFAVRKSYSSKCVNIAFTQTTTTRRFLISYFKKFVLMYYIEYQREAYRLRSTVILVLILGSGRFWYPPKTSSIRSLPSCMVCTYEKHIFACFV